MNDLISRQAAIAAVNIGNLNRGIVDALQNIISELPSAVNHGVWIIKECSCKPVYMVCSICGHIFKTYAGLEEEWNYCPHCGACVRNRRFENAENS